MSHTTAHPDRPESGAPNLLSEGEGARLPSILEDSAAEDSTVGLRASRARHDALLQVALDAIIIIDRYGRIREFNPAAEATFGYARADVIGRPIAETIIPPSLRPLHHEGFARYLAMGEGPILGRRIEVIGMRKDGAEFPVELAILPLGDADGLEFVAYLRDITARREAARAQEALLARRHAIASQLQDALQPPMPAGLPGLRLAPWTRAAHDRGRVGGDFLDAFALDGARGALVVGDASGKGVPAAAQVATVRPMLRAVLYADPEPAGAVARLNAMLTTHDLLAGFVTAFVGVFDAETGALAYASCGHEPALLRRAGTNAVESLSPTGPPLGVDAGAAFDARTVRLDPGDSLLLFTDGLSDSGPSHDQMLGAEGVSRLLQALPAGSDASAQAEALAAHAATHAGGVFLDDVALLLACRT